MKRKVAFWVDGDDYERVWTKFKQLLMQRDGTLYRTFGREITRAIEEYMRCLEEGVKKRVNSLTLEPSKIPLRSRWATLRRIWDSLPDGSFSREVLNRLIERYAGGSKPTLLSYRKQMLVWGLIEGGPNRFLRGRLPDWLGDIE